MPLITKEKGKKTARQIAAIFSRNNFSYSPLPEVARPMTIPAEKDPTTVSKPIFSAITPNELTING